VCLPQKGGKGCNKLRQCDLTVPLQIWRPKSSETPQRFPRPFPASSGPDPLLDLRSLLSRLLHLVCFKDLASSVIRHCRCQGSAIDACGDLSATLDLLDPPILRSARNHNPRRSDDPACRPTPRTGCRRIDVRELQHVSRPSACSMPACATMPHCKFFLPPPKNLSRSPVSHWRTSSTNRS
jgi:hypothetical protein